MEKVTVTAKKKEEKLRFDNRMSFTSPRWLSPEDIEDVPPADYEGLLYRISGVDIEYGSDGRQIVVRRTPAIILVNGIIIDEEGNYDKLESRLNVSEVGQVEIFTDRTETLLYGTGKPVVAFTTWPVSYKRNFEKSNTEYSKVIVPLGYQKPIEFYSPRYDTPEALENPTPDLRSTIYWKPDIFLQDTNETSLDFYSADTPTSYSILIEGIGNNRNFIYRKEEGRIKITE